MVLDYIFIIVIIFLLIAYYTERKILRLTLYDIAKESLHKKYHEQSALTAHHLIAYLCQTKEQVPFAFAIVGSDKRIKHCNRLFNIVAKQKDCAGLSYEDFTHEEDLKGDNVNVDAVMEAALPGYDMPKRYIGDKFYRGEIAYVMLTVFTVRPIKDQPSKFLAVIRPMKPHEKEEFLRGKNERG